MEIGELTMEHIYSMVNSITELKEELTLLQATVQELIEDHENSRESIFDLQHKIAELESNIAEL